MSKLKSVSLKNYRNISDFQTEISAGTNIIIANNGSGKTNFIESIFYSIYGTSFRNTESSTVFISINEEFCRTFLKWEDFTTEQITSIAGNKSTKKFLLNGKATNSRKLISLYPIIVFAPHSVDLISGEPQTRRDDLDRFLVTFHPDYSAALQKYKVTLRNRNAVLRNIQEGKSTERELQFWTDNLVKSASFVFSYRFNFFEGINSYMRETAEAIYHDFKNFSLVYLPNIQSTPDEFEIVFRNKLTNNSFKELAAGKTLYGVHKDDYELKLNDKTLRYYGSRGQQRIGSFILKASQLKYYQDQHSKTPLLLIDDLMSELDDNHRKSISEFILSQGIQCVITGADRKEIPEILLQKSNNIVFA